MNKSAKDLIYLLSCAVNGITPDKASVQAMDLEQLYQLAKAHSLRAAVYIALRSADAKDVNFQQAYNKAVRKNVLLDMERTAIFAEMEHRGIWYMPLKGSVLKDLYPENGMREMADNDVLYDAGKRTELREIMLSMGYSAESDKWANPDVYMKPPVLNFEMHTLLFGAAIDFYAYYQNPKRLMIPDEGSKYGYHFSDEDFYPTSINIVTDSLLYSETQKISESRYKCQVFDLKEGSNDITIEIIEQGCPPISSPWRINYNKPSAKTKHKETVEIKKKTKEDEIEEEEDLHFDY